MDYEKKLALAKEALDSGSYDKETIEYIFPELKESEDERIRKAMIEGFEDYQQPDAEWWNGIKVKDCIAWLEKQGEQKDILEDAILDSNEDGLIAETIKVGKVKKSQRIVSAEAKEAMYDKPAWSEEDEEQFSFCCAAIELSNYSSDEYRNYAISFLKSLKDRVQPQPKPSTIKFNGPDIDAMVEDFWNNKDVIISSHTRGMVEEAYRQGLEDMWNKLVYKEV